MKKKHLFRYIIYVLLLTSCQMENGVKQTYSKNDSLSSNVERKDSVYLYVKDSHYDFGTIKKIDIPELLIDFKLKNNGTDPLVISKADVSCGCVSVNFPKEPIMPNKEKSLQVKINTANQYGFFNKTVILKSNAPEKYTLIRIKGNIK